MKQVLILILFFVCIIVSFAQSYAEMASNAVVTGGNVDNKVLLYKVNKKDILAPFLLNFFFGFGIGSFVQGDITGGLLVLGSEILSLSLVGCGIYSLSQHTGTSTPTLGLSLVSLGGITFFVTRIAEMIIPFTYASSYNRKLQEKLGMFLGGFKPQFEINLNENAGLSFELAFTKKY
ncbi:P13 family porin (plasmid) [Borrelia miyamotoi]|uniref:P13 family porin n=1 Tax=Borrelia miyamotoi TaxID=47466 RepID=A0A5P8AWY4_9SPIR|nr:P13 family porin [Borrelia miyamotoi]QFP42423.1 P13 family porin [Borrelia miyamotoi]WAZ72428.1 P13 family porin [Borrelia miyamotoi]WVI05348.1 P13 family porin [Borrelia miyamotoi]